MVTERKINILGTNYKIYFYDESDKFPSEENDGLCIPSKKEIHINYINTKLADSKVIQYNILKHEIVHAFFFESGLDLKYSDDEVLVDWIALQIEKIIEAIKGGIKRWELILEIL